MNYLVQNVMLVLVAVMEAAAAGRVGRGRGERSSVDRQRRQPTKGWTDTMPLIFFMLRYKIREEGPLINENIDEL